MIRLRLVNEDESIVIDALSGDLRVEKGWTPQWTSLQQKGLSLGHGYQASSSGYSPVIETMPMVALGCPDDVRNAIRDLERFLDGASGYQDDPLVENAHWLEWQSEGESAKRVLVVGGAWQVSPRAGIWLRSDAERTRISAALTHHPLWENSTSESDNATALSVVGGMWAWTDTTGRVPARISRMEFVDNDDAFYGGADNAITTVWAGWRPKYKGLTEFNPVWECESTATGGGHSTFDDAGETTNVIDGTYHNSASAHTIFTDTDLKQRLHITVYTVNGSSTTDAKHFAGRYVVLCRTWVDADTASLEMRYGYHDSGHITACDLVAVDNTAPHFKELGTIQIPSVGLWPETTLINYDDQCADFCIWLHSAGEVGHMLDMDCLVLIPADYFVKLEKCHIHAAAPEALGAVLTIPNDRVVGAKYDAASGLVLGASSVSPLQWYLPTGDSTLVIAAEQDEGQDIDDLLDVTVDWYPRWTSYRA